MTLLSYFYQFGVGVRNKLYDLNISKTEPTQLPTISVGNITVGGTGKTPHTEYLIELLRHDYRLAYLSRGYKRHTSGFVLADDKSTSTTIGDEAQQIHVKYPDITVAVDKHRKNAIRHLAGKTPPPQLVILDDAYQHRRITPDINILLVDFNRPIHLDKFLPCGQLRESAQNTDRADIIIVTKCPDSIQPVDVLTFRNQLNPMPYQSLYFSKIEYLDPIPAFGGESFNINNANILALTGIAQPKHFTAHLRKFTQHISTLSYSDHHNFSASNIKHIVERFNKLDPNHRAIITTEKDFARLQNCKIPEDLKPYIYIIPIKIKFIFDSQDKFDTQIIKTVQKIIKNPRK